MKIEVLKVHVLPGDKSTRAFCDVLIRDAEIGDIVIHDFRVIQGNRRAYVRAPFTTYKTQTGELGFRQIVDLPDEVRGQVDTLILSAFYREKEKVNESTGPTSR